MEYSWSIPEIFTQLIAVPDNDPNKTLLGKKQWEWLSNKLDENADIRIIASSIQIIAEGHGFEKWGNLPREKKKLYDLIDSKKIKDIIFLSGDRHAGGIYKEKTTKGTMLYEITSSSLNLPGAAWVTKYKGKERKKVPKVAYHTFNKRFEKMTKDEGFHKVIEYMPDIKLKYCFAWFKSLVL